MMGIELTTSQKAQVGFIALILGIAVFMFFYNTRPAPDDSVNAWTTYPRKYPVDKTKPVSPTNPFDPKKQGAVTVFACYDGRLEITEYHNDPTHRPTIVWVYVDPRRPGYIYYKDPMAPVKALKDAYPHAIALAAYSAANGTKLGLMAEAGLTADQLALEKKARDAMTDQLTVITMGVDNGTFHLELMEKVMTALNNYRRTQGDPQKDKGKAQSVREVLKTATAYLDKIQIERGVIINKYISEINGILTADQKAKVVEKAKQVEAGMVKTVTPAKVPPQPRPATPNTTTPPRGATPNNRGNAAPARGAAG